MDRLKAIKDYIKGLRYNTSRAPKCIGNECLTNTKTMDIKEE